MNRKQLEKELTKIGLTLYKANIRQFDGRLTKWYVAQNYTQYMIC